MKSPTKLGSFLPIGKAVLLSLIVGSTLVFAQEAVRNVGPLTVSGLRFMLAALLLAPFAFRRLRTTRLPRPVWRRLIIVGISFYVVGNGALFWGVKYIPATTASLLLNVIPLLVLGASVVWLKEAPTRWQVLGVLTVIGGGVLFFMPGLQPGEPLGIGLVAVGLVGIASFSIVGRELARDRVVDTLCLTAVPLTIGGVILLPIALSMEGIPSISLRMWLIIAILSVVNTAAAYLLFNHVLRALAALEVSVVLSLSPLVTAFWAWLLLGDRLGTVPIIGMAIVVVGVVIVQLTRRRRATGFD